MKKFTAILVAIVLALFVVSCGSSSKDDNKDNNDTDTSDTDTTADTGDDTDTTADTGDDADTEEGGCKLDNSILESDAERYFAYKGSGEIQDLEALNAGLARPVLASGVKTSLVGVEDVEYEGVQQISLFVLTELTGETEEGEKVSYPSVAALAIAYGEESSTQVIVAVPLEYIDYMKQYETYVLDQAPIVQVVKFTDSSDDVYSKSCMMAGNKISGQVALGKMQVCYDKNESFALGEIFKLAVVAELSTQEEMVDNYTDVDSIEDLCSCVNSKEKTADGEYVEVDCDAVDWEGKCGGNAMLDEDGECVCNDGYVINEKGKCADPCKEAKCGEDEVCKADKTAEKGYVCEKKEVTPATDEAACVAEGGTWADNTCNCGADKTWDATEKKCKAAAPATDEAACTTAGGTWAENTCNCGEGKTWNATAKTCDAE